jgi:hypothetical protein
MNEDEELFEADERENRVKVQILERLGVSG